MFGIASAASAELAIEKVSAAAQMKMSSAQSLRVIALSGCWGGSISPAAGWYRQRHDIRSVITSTDWCPASVIRLTSYQLVGMVRFMTTTPQPQHESKAKILDAALQVIRTKGYAATTVDDVCHAAGLTKGSFFHHFKSKDELALAATAHFATMADGLFAAAPYRALSDPRDRVTGYVKFRKAILTGE